MKGFKSTSANPYTYTQSGVWKKGQYTFQAIVISDSGYAIAFQKPDLSWGVIDLSWQVQAGQYCSVMEAGFTLEYDAVAFRLIANDVTGEVVVLSPMLEQGGNPSTPIAHEEDLRGMDGDFHEFIFTRNDTGIAPDAPLSTQEDDLEPTGWTDNPQGVTKALPFEFVSMREKKVGVWLDFSPPSLWAKWSEDGLSVYLRKQGHYESRWVGTEKVTDIVGGEMFGGTELIKVTAVFHKGEADVAPTESLSRGFQWYVNGVHLPAFDDQHYITLDSTYGDGFADIVKLSYIVNSLREEIEVEVMNISAGMDGIGEEFIFKANNSGTVPPVLPRTTDTNYQDDDYYGQGTANVWSDDPVAPTELKQYVWTAKRKKVGGVWEAFGTPSLWTWWVTDGGDAAYWELHSSAPLIYKDAEDASTSGAHTTITLSGRHVEGDTSQNGGYISVQPNGGVEDTPLLSPRVFTPPNNAGVDGYVIRLYDKVSKTTLLDTLTVPIAFKGERGVSAINITLSNEADVLPASSEGVVTDYTGSGTIIRVFEGATELAYGAGNGQYQVSASGSGINVGSASTSGKTRVYGVASNMTADNATITFTVSGKTADGVSFSFTKTQSFSKSRTGASAPLLYLSASAQVMKCNPDNTPQTGQTISIEAKLQNVSGTATFVATPYNDAGTALTKITLGGTGNIRTLISTQWLATYKRVEVVATLGSLSDTVTIARLSDGKEGENSYTVLLSNENHTFAGTGTTALAGSTETQILIYKGTERVFPASITVNTADLPTGMSRTISLGTARVTFNVTTSMTSPNGTIPITFVVEGRSMTILFSYSISFKGADGEDGITIIANQQGHTYRADLNGGIIGSLADGMVELTITSGSTPITCPSATSGGTPTANGTYRVTRTLGSGITTNQSVSGGKYRITPATLTVDEASVELEIKIMMGGVVTSYPLTLTYRKQFDGADGKSTEFIFKGSTSDTTAPTRPSTSQQDDWYGQGTSYVWNDDLIEPTKTLPYVWASQRKKVDGVWGAFTTPKVWLRWAEDGDGIVSTTIHYAKSQNGVTPPTVAADWGTSLPTPTKGWYLWTRTTTVYKKSPTTVAYTTSYWAEDGDDGDGNVHIYRHSLLKPATPTSGVANPTGWVKSPDKGISISTPTNWTLKDKWYQSAELTTLGETSISVISFTTTLPNQVVALELWEDGYASYDYLYAGNLNIGVTTSNYYDRVIGGKKTISYDVPNAGSHTIQIMWRKGITAAGGSNRGYFAIIKNVKVWRSTAAIINNIYQSWSSPEEYYPDTSTEETIYCLSKTETPPLISDSAAYIDEYLPLPCTLASYRGNFSTSRAYAIAQVVVYSGEYYKIIKAVPSSYTGNPTNTEYFENIKGWTDNAKGATAEFPFEYRSKRKKSGGAWGAFSASTVDSRWVEDGDPAKTITLSANATKITVGQGNVSSPTQISVKTTAVNTTVETWEYSINGGAFTTTKPSFVTVVSTTERTISSSTLFKTITLRASRVADEASDIITISREGGAPYVDSTTRTWWEWRDSSNLYVDTGMSPVGSDGVVPYPAGYYDSTKRYRREQDYTPYVQYGEVLYLLIKDAPNAGILPTNTTYWKAFNQWEAVFISSLVAQFAKIGGAIFTGDTSNVSSNVRGRLISQKGVNNTNDYNTYTGDSGSWQPKLMLDFETGKSKFEETQVSGSLIAKQGNSGMKTELDASGIRVYNVAGQMNIRFGMKDDYAVLQYFDNAGNFLYDLGPSGIMEIEIREEKWTVFKLIPLGGDMSTILNSANRDKYKKSWQQTETTYYAYTSKIVAGINQDPTNDGAIFISRSKTGARIPIGFYCGKREKNWNLIYRHPSGGNPNQIINSQLPYIQSGNENVYDRNNICYMPIDHYINGKRSTSFYSAYWNETPEGSPEIPEI